MRKTALLIGAAGIATALGWTALTSTSDAQDRGWRDGASLTKVHQGGGRGFHGRRHHGGRDHGMQMLQRFDTNGDRRLTQGEIDQFRAGQIERADTNGDGNLSLEEYQNLWLEAMRERMVDDFQRHDDDGDGQVTPEEFNERFVGLVERFDRNGDGVLDREDRGWRGGRGGDRNGPGRGQMPPSDDLPDGDDSGSDNEL